MNFSKITALLFLLIFTQFVLAQRGKDGDYTVTIAGDVVNAYSNLTVNGNAGFPQIVVANNALNGSGHFTTPLQQGDLVLIIQMQGATPNIDITNGFGILAGPGQNGFYSPGEYNQHGPEFGSILNYGNAGNFELREVFSVSGTTNITLTCPLQNNYSDDGAAQVIRVPRYQNLTLNANTTITAPTWNGLINGVVAVEVNGNLVFGNNSRIDVNARGFRPGLATGVNSSPGSTAPHGDGIGNGSTLLGASNNVEGSAKGEGICGFTTRYSTWNSVYGRGAIGNGGGGAGYQNAGGGGGSNVGTGTFTGKGRPNATYNTSWNLEDATMVGMNSPGGGRGGYSLAQTDQNELTVGPNNSSWGGDARKQNGGYGGHGLAYNVNKIFLGGGGGAGGHDSNQGGSGGHGGGIAVITVYGNISGTGSIQANGQNGQNSNPLGLNANLANPVRGNDGAGGGGGGGYIYIKNANPIPFGTITLSANGGEGGDQDLRYFSGPANEIGGPGAGGAGGGIAFTSGTPTQSVVGGAAGINLRNNVVNSWVTNFPVNGATDGGNGISSLPSTIFDIITTNDTICAGESGTLTASIVGTPTGTLQWFTAPFGGTALNAGQGVGPLGATFTPNPMPATTTTYYVGRCPGTFRQPVTLVVGQNPTISGTATITNATCNTQGSITGLSASGGVNPLTFSWNGSPSATIDLPSASAGNYTLTVTDANGCASQSGPHTITGTGGPVISGTPTIVNATCTANGSITGLSATGVATLTYSWSGTSTPSADFSAGAGSYTLTVTDGNTCTATSGPHVIGTTAGPTITGTVNVTDATCTSQGQITGLSITGGVGPFDITWNGNVSASMDLTGATPGNYTVQVTDNNGCVVSNGPHTIGTTPAQVINGTAVVTDATCTAAGSITGLTTSGGLAPYTFSWNGNTSPTEDLTSAPTGNYTLTVTDDNGCAVTSGPYTIGTTPGPSITGTAVIIDATCLTGGSITGLSATGGVGPYGYAWNPGLIAGQNLTNAPANTYTLTVVDINGCTALSGPHTINLIGGPTFDITSMVISDETCGQANGTITGITVSGGTPNYTFTWNGNPSATADLSASAAGNYTLEVTDDNGCTASSGPHAIANIPAPTINDAAVLVTPADCSGALGTISGITTTGNNLSFQYSNGGGTSLNASGLNPGNYNLTITDQVTGCSATSGPYVVGGIAAPSIDETNVFVTNATCSGAFGSISGLTATGTGNLTFSWTNTPAQTIDLNGLVAGNYTLTVTDDATGCTDQAGPFVINFIGGPTANFTFQPTEPNVGETVVFTDQSTGTVMTWNWSIDVMNSLNQNETYAFLEEGIYPVILTVMDQNGCMSIDTQYVQVFDDITIPNVITPNFDNVNDAFVIKGLKPNTEVLILNRWGEEVWYNSNYQNEWIGKDKKGLFVSDGVYTYIVTPINGSQKQGFVHVVRND